MRVLVLNSGSSSLKFALFDVACEGGGRLSASRAWHGAITGIGGEVGSHLTMAGSTEPEARRPMTTHGQAVAWMFERLKRDDVEAVGHRVVHGGARFADSVRIDEAVIGEIDRLAELAPLHNPACLAGIRASREALGEAIPMVAVFDTAFFHDLPDTAAAYALDRDLAAKHRIRRYGFHGIAHASLLEGYAAGTGRPLAETRVIALHLGNGCSAAAIREGWPVDTSMGFTPLEGLVMGTRSGDLDPAVVGYLAQREGVPVETVEGWLNERSGLLGLSGRTREMGALLEAADEAPRAAFAIELFCYRARKYVGAYLAVLGGADAILFGGGIGERAPTIRARICAGMDWCGIELDSGRNTETVGLPPGGVARISRAGAKPEVYVVGVDEETWIARETMRCLGGIKRGGDDGKTSV